MYKILVRSFLFLFKAEFSHNFVLRFLKIIFKLPGMSSFFSFFYCIEDPRLQRKLFGLTFKNPVGLAAGFDKNAQVFNEFSSLGFGFIEVGTVTPVSQPGNPKPRIFRLNKDNALINRLGFNNEGVDVVVERIKKKYTNIIIGGNIGKNKVTPNKLAVSDYVKCFEKIAPYVDYLVLNVSSPNTPDLVELQNKSYLNDLLSQIQSLNQTTYKKPILVKISPDLSFSQIDEVIELVIKFNISGLIATNTSSNRITLKTPLEKIQKIGAGGLSGQPIYTRSKEVVSYISKKTNGSIPVIAVGGIFTADDAVQMLNAGASLVQIYTGFIYNGPSLIKKINQKILQS
ncbi:MAG: dihydroorotate dehydrogenase (quinone) [Flavobacteriales bacterium]|nr:dihydroorotate dehydrogenase (quinone) [Flavobacteriales bacterium]